MNPAPRVSVVVPVHNRAGLVEETLESLLAQTAGRALEIVVVDDGSTDDTPRVLERYAARVRVFHQPNRGVSEARNLALSKARGDWIAFCDSDDLWPPDKTQRQLALLERHPRARFLYGHFVCFETTADGARRQWTLEQPTPSGFILPHLLERNFIVPATAMVAREAIAAVGGFDTECRNAEDYDFFLRLAARYEALYDPEVSCFYRQHPGTASRQNQRYWEGFLASLAKARLDIAQRAHEGDLRDPTDGRPVPPERLRAWDRLLRRRLASFRVRLSRLARKDSDPARAWSEAREALRLAPGWPRTWSALAKAARQRLLRGIGKS